MSYDFRASQVKTNKIIASGSTGTSASIIIYGHECDGDPPNHGNLSPSFLTNSIGSDTFLYISGSEEKRSVFGGGLTLSGTVYALQGLPIGQTGLETYQEGLFEDWTGRTTVGAAVREINNILKALAPPLPPVLDSIGVNQSGQSGKLTIDLTTNTLTSYQPHPEKTLEQTYSLASTTTTKSLGVVASGLTFTGTIADDISTGPGAPYAAYAANAFGRAQYGKLILILNGSVVREIDLTVAGAVSDAGTGFSLSEAQSVVFSGTGITFDGYKYRTGSWKVVPASQTNGYNSLTVRHEYSHAVIYSTKTIEWFVDEDTTAVAYSNESTRNLIMTGTKYLSGVKYYTGGSFHYVITGSNAYKNTYSTNNITFAQSYGLQSIAASSFPASAGNQNAPIELLKPVAFETSGIRLIDGSVNVRTSIPRVLTSQPTSTSTGAIISNILIDNIPGVATGLVESFTSERYRLPSNLDYSDKTLDTDLWDSTVSITATEAGYSAGYSDGLLVGEGKLKIGSRNYSAITNGPISNANYSVDMGTGNRTYYRVFVNGVAGCANFIANLQGSNVSFISAANSFTATNQMKLEFTAPTQSGWLCAYNDFISGQYDTGNGGRAASFGAGRALNTNWGLTIGIKNIVSSGYRIYIRLTVPYNFIGYLTNISFTFIE